MRLLILLLALSVPVFAQTQTATTPKGRKVILNPDGTWRYADVPATAKQSTISVEAGIVYLNGAQPVARENFWVLNKPVTEIIQAEFKDLPEIKEPFDLALSLKNALVHPKEVQRWMAVVKKYEVLTFTTGFDGKASFSLAPGQFYIFGITKTRTSFGYWNIPLVVTGENQNITLDQNNAGYIK